MHIAAPRMAGIAPSPVARLRRRAAELRGEGRDIIELSSGDLDFPTPAHVIAAAHAAALNGETRYTDAGGTAALKDAVRATFARQHGLAYARDEIIISSGSSQALYNALMVTLAPGDEVIVPSPYWAPYLGQIRLAEGVPVIVPCAQNNGFKLRPEDLAAAITPRTRWLIINSPVNPTGALYTAAELETIAAVLLDFPQILIMSDGLYEHMVFGGGHAPTLAGIAPRLRERTLTVSGVAKSYAMMGWRIGYAGGPTDLIKDMTAIQSLTTLGPSSISQAAALAALTGPQELLRERIAILAQRRDGLTELLNRCEGLSCTRPEATFYLLAGCAGLIGKRTPDGRRIDSDRDVAAHLLDAAGVAVLPGSDVGLSPFIRFTCAAPMPVLEEAGRRIAQACRELLT